MMVELRLIDNNDKYVEYSIHDHDIEHKFVSVMRVYKRNLRYIINGKELKISNKFEAHAYRQIKKMIESNSFPRVFYYGWG